MDRASCGLQKIVKQSESGTSLLSGQNSTSDLWDKSRLMENLRRRLHILHHFYRILGDHANTGNSADSSCDLAGPSGRAVWTEACPYRPNHWTDRVPGDHVNIGNSAD